MIGLYVLPILYMADDLEWTVDQAKAALAAIEKRGMIVYDHAAQLVFIRNYFKYNRLSSGAREKGAIARLEEMSDSPLMVRLATAVAEQYPLLQELRSYLALRCHEGTLFGVQVVSNRTPVGPLDIDIDIAKAKDRDKALKKKFAATDKLIDFLNDLTDSKFRHSKASREPIHARLAEGATEDDVCLVFEHKAAQWKGKTEWEQYLNPQTLCRPTKFENNLNAARKWDRTGRPSLNGQKGATPEELAAWAIGGD